MATEAPAERAVTERLFNRELSWLEFNSRVLAQAESGKQPLLERAKFIAIHGSNLDEFFQVRVAGLKDQVAGGITKRTQDGRTPLELLHEIRGVVDAQLDRVDAVYHSLTAELAEAGIELADWADLDNDDRKFLVGEFEDHIYPVLTPLAVDVGHPFPYISNLSLNLGVLLRDPGSGETRFARVKVPPLIERFMALPGGNRFIPAEQVIAHHLDRLFIGMEVLETVAFRVTRNSDLTIDEEEAEDLLEAVEMELRRRRFRSVVRVEVEKGVSPDLRQLLVDEMGIDQEDVYTSGVPLDLGGLWSIWAIDRPELKDEVWSPVTPPELRAAADDDIDIFAVLREREVLVHHPYTSFSSSVQEFIRQAANDPKVLAIKLTLYRTSGDSPIVDSLIRAADSGKQVAVLVELKARFDEEANIEWAKRLERAGAHVAYGLAGLKVHSKTALVIRAESDGLRRYCHVGTGNYNNKTARIYEDLGLLTADPAVGADLGELFNSLTGYGRDIVYERLVVAPQDLRGRITELMRNEASYGSDGRMVLKMNSLVDAKLIDELYAASQAGVDIQLIVRGICCLRPGIPGLSDTIDVRSIVGRYLEHSRIYHFANGDGPGEPAYLIGSGDLMPRNLDRRIEALVPVLAPELRERLHVVLETALGDDKLAWRLGPDGEYVRIESNGGWSTQERLQALEQERAASAKGVRAY